MLGFCLFPLAGSTAAAVAVDAASPGGKVEKKHLKLAELANVQLCAFLGVERDMMRITCESSAVIMQKNQQGDILTPPLLWVSVVQFLGFFWSLWIQEQA